MTDMTDAQPLHAGAAATHRPARTHPRFLRAYLSDHLALSAGIGALAERVRDADRWREQRARFVELVAVLEQDREDLERVLTDRDIKPDPLKRSLARLGERVGRLKGNGRILRTSPLTRLIELEGLQLGLVGCVAPWLTLRDLGVDGPRADVALIRLARQQETLEQLRAEVVRTSFAD